VKVAPPPKLEQPEFADTPAVSVEEMEELLKSGKRVQVIDVRPRHYITKATEIMDAAVWRDLERLEGWIAKLNRDHPVVTFCVYGMASTSAARRRWRFVRGALTPSIWPVAGGPRKVP
jgi:superoxide dismutase, Fe-Mn family